MAITRLGASQSRSRGGSARSPGVPRSPRSVSSETKLPPCPCARGAHGDVGEHLPRQPAGPLAKAARGWQELCAVRSDAERRARPALSLGQGHFKGHHFFFSSSVFFLSDPRSGASAHKRAGNALRPLFLGDGAWAARDVRTLGASWVVLAMKHRRGSQGSGGPRVGPR